MAEKFPVKVQSLRLRQSLSLWERWHGASRDGEGELRQRYHITIWAWGVPSRRSSWAR